eukprot:144131-Pyramimonas_sp.AAC.1
MPWARRTRSPRSCWPTSRAMPAPSCFTLARACGCPSVGCLSSLPLARGRSRRCRARAGTVQ